MGISERAIVSDSRKLLNAITEKCIKNGVKFYKKNPDIVAKMIGYKIVEAAAEIGLKPENAKQRKFFKLASIKGTILKTDRKVLEQFYKIRMSKDCNVPVNLVTERARKEQKKRKSHDFNSLEKLRAGKLTYKDLRASTEYDAQQMKELEKILTSEELEILTTDLMRGKVGKSLMEMGEVITNILCQKYSLCW